MLHLPRSLKQLEPRLQAKQGYPCNKAHNESVVSAGPGLPLQVFLIEILGLRIKEGS